jgi:hypothetical protein
MEVNILELIFQDDIEGLTLKYQHYKKLLNKIMTEASESDYKDIKPFQEKILKRVKFIHENMILLGIKIEELKLSNSILLSNFR